MLRPLRSRAWFQRVLHEAAAVTLVESYRPFKELAAAALRTTFAQLGLDVARTEPLDALSEFAPYPDAQAALARLREAGATVVTLTNGSYESTERLLEAGQLRDDVDLLLPCDVQAFKPHRAPYELALGRVAGAATMVAAHGWDVLGARAAGMDVGLDRPRRARVAIPAPRSATHGRPGGRGRARPRGGPMRAKIVHGVAAGLTGTAVMTPVQKLLGGGGSSSGEPPSWENASAPAQVARKALAAVGHDPPPSWIPFLTNAMHWGYGTTSGVLYTLARGDLARAPVGSGLIFGTLVWAASYVQLVPLGIYEPPWTYDAKTLSTDLSYHLAFGVGVSSIARVVRSERG